MSFKMIRLGKKEWVASDLIASFFVVDDRITVLFRDGKSVQMAGTLLDAERIAAEINAQEVVK